MKRTRLLSLALVLFASMVGLSAAQAGLGIQISLSSQSLCGPTISHEIKVTWRITGGQPPLQVTIELTDPSGNIQSFGEADLEGTITFRLMAPDGGQINLHATVRDSAGVTASAEGSAMVGPCRREPGPLLLVGLVVSLTGPRASIGQKIFEGAWNEAKQLSIELLVADDQSDVSTQVAEAQRLLDQSGLKALLIHPIEIAPLAPVLDRAQELGIPVITIELALPGADLVPNADELGGRDAVRKAAGKHGSPDCAKARTCIRLDFEQPRVERESPIPTNQYAKLGVLFPGRPALFKPARGTNSGAQALMNGQLAKEFDPGSLVIQFTTPQKRVKAFVGEARGFTLHPAMMRAFDASGRLIAQKGPIVLAPDVKTPIEIQSSQSDITRVEIEIGASSFEAIDDLEFDQAGPPPPPDASAPKVTITEPKDGATISADDPFVVLAGTVSEDRRLLRDEVRVTIINGKNSRSFTMLVAGRSPTFSFGPTRVGPLFEGTNTITVYAQDENNLSDSASVRVSYSRPLPPLIGIPPTPIAFSLGEGGRRLTSTIPLFTSACRVGDPCEDRDADGIADTWENIAMEILTPVVELDEEENWIEDPNNRRNHHVVNFVRVVPYVKGDKRYVLFFYVATWSRDYGRFSFVDHNGDTERTIMAWRVLDDRTMRLSMVYTAAHEGHSNDHSGVWDADIVSCNEMKVPGWSDEPLCALLEFVHVSFGLPRGASPRPQDIPGFRLKLQASEDKHATYPSAELCEEVTLFPIPFAPDIGEDCGGGGRHGFQAFNAGEPDRPFIDRLDKHPQLRSIFPGEAIWTDLYGDSKFCGGLARGGDCGGGHLSEKLGLCARSNPKRVCLPEILRSKL